MVSFTWKGQQHKCKGHECHIPFEALYATEPGLIAESAINAALYSFPDLTTAEVFA